MTWSEPVHFSHLKYMADCPAAFKYAVDNVRDDTAYFRIGRAFHRLALGIGERVMVYEGRRDDRCAEWRACKEEHADATILIASEWKVAKPMADAVLRDPVAAPLLKRCTQREREVSTRMLGFDCVGHVDASDEFVIDLKSDKDVSPVYFQRRGRRMGYLAQLDWYRNLMGRPNLPCYCVAVGKKPPHLVVVHKPTEAALEQGRQQWRGWLEMLRTCADSDIWPGYSSGIVEWDAELDESAPALPFEHEGED